MDFLLPELGEGVYEAELVRWLVKPGDVVKRGQALMEVLTDKATMEVPAPFAGTISELRVEDGALLKIGDAVLSYSTGEEAPATGKPTRRRGKAELVGREAERVPTTTEEKSATPSNGPSVPVKAAPSVRYLARKLGIDINRIRGSGPQGRILVDDLKPQEVPARGAEPQPTKSDDGTPGTRVKLHGLRRVIAERMMQSKHTIAHYTYVDECDVTEMVRLRTGLREVADKIGVKVTYLAFFVKAVTVALREVPLVNATLDEAAGEIILHDKYHIGIAVATPGGLIVPVVRDADKKDLLTIAREIDRLSSDARAGKVKREDLGGATFSITSIGNIGGLFATPIISPPEVGILGIGKVVKRPVFDAAGNIKAADMVYLSLSFDHRVLDGAVGAAFGNAVIRQVQNPVGLMVLR